VKKRFEQAVDATEDSSPTIGAALRPVSKTSGEGASS
jgi:hypothetical protein